MLVAANAVAGFAPSPVERTMADFWHVGDVSVSEISETVIVTESGAGPDDGVTMSAALAASYGVVEDALGDVVVVDVVVVVVVDAATVIVTD